jgi:hypothetical protein
MEKENQAAFSRQTSIVEAEENTNQESIDQSEAADLRKPHHGNRFEDVEDSERLIIDEEEEEEEDQANETKEDEEEFMIDQQNQFKIRSRFIKTATGGKFKVLRFSKIIRKENKEMEVYIDISINDVLSLWSALDQFEKTPLTFFFLNRKHSYSIELKRFGFPELVLSRSQGQYPFKFNFSMCYLKSVKDVVGKFVHM